MFRPTGVILLICICLTAAEFRDSVVSGSKPRKCFSCEGINCQRTTRQNATVTCTDLLDICVTVFEDAMVSERGCLSGISQAGKSKCEVKDKQCQKCSGELCNNLGHIDYQCIQCNGSEDSKCNSEGDTLKPTQCAVPTSRNSYCYVRVVGQNLQRGCALSVQEQQNCLSDNDCSICLPENAPHLGACNNYNLSYKSGAAQAQQLVAPLLAIFSVLTLRVLQ